MKERGAQVVARLVGGHKGAITHLIAIPGKSSTSPELLVSAAADGSIAIWDPSGVALKGPEKEVTQPPTKWLIRVH